MGTAKHAIAEHLANSHLAKPKTQKLEAIYREPNAKSSRIPCVSKYQKPSASTAFAHFIAIPITPRGKK